VRWQFEGLALNLQERINPKKRWLEETQLKCQSNGNKSQESFSLRCLHGRASHLSLFGLFLNRQAFYKSPAFLVASGDFQEGFSLRYLQLISVASYQMLPDTQPAAASLCAPSWWAAATTTPKVGRRRRRLKNGNLRSLRDCHFDCAQP